MTIILLYLQNTTECVIYCHGVILKTRPRSPWHVGPLWDLTIVALKPNAVPLHFIQCPFPNQIQFGLEKLHPKIAYNFPNQFQFGLERKKRFCKTQIPNQIQIGLEKSLTIANALNQFQFYFVKSHFRKGKNSNI